ncbi:4-coumarate--CoA ligase 1 [Toxocara canis]|uniref:4-coumarate--CoA ligase 1 n=1 Tax=Toxocara canis TaxID=6265 RepID=A0A0B2V895_TOXCA|nr:4-coumarate--CoA ligase 1 [Toxocara canis]
MASDEDECIIRSGYPTPELQADVSFCDYFLHTIVPYENNIAMIEPERGTTITYTAFALRVERMRSALYRIGVLHGDVIGMYTGNSADFIMFCLAATSIGAIVTPINPAYKTYEVEKYFCEAHVKWVVTEERYFDALSKGILLQSVQALIFFSSGTTGPPKGVILSNRSLMAAIEVVRIAGREKSDGFEMAILDGHDVVYGVLPYFHAGGLITVYCMLAQGAKLVVNRKFDGAKFLETIERYKATIVLDSAQTTFRSFGLQSFLSDQIERITVEKAVIGEDPALIFFSSGTTGPPKGVILSNRSLMAAIEVVRIAGREKSDGFEMAILDGHDVVYGVLPYFHAGGLITVYCMLAQGAKLVVNRKFDGAKFLETIERYKVTTLNLVPATLNFMAECPFAKVPCLSTLRHIFVGAARVETHLLHKIKEKLLAAETIELYGTTEAGAMIFMHPTKCEVRPGSCGIPLPGVQCKVLDIEQRTACGPLQSGEICLRTPTMMSAYLSGKEQHGSLTPDGWFQTGDIGYYDEDKFVYITGRIREMIKVRGWQVSPYEIEEVMLEIPEIEQCVVVGIPDEQAGQLPRAYVKLRQGAHLNEDAINKIIKAKFVSYKQLTGGIEFVDRMPTTASGKIARNQLLSTLTTHSNK